MLIMKLLILKHTPMISNLSKWERVENIPYRRGQHRNHYILFSFLLDLDTGEQLKTTSMERHYEKNLY